MCFTAGLMDVGITDPRLRSTLTAWFAAMIAEMGRQPGSRDEVPRARSWDGRVG